MPKKQGRGRPRKYDKPMVHVQVRVTEEHRDRLRAAARLAGMSFQDYLAQRLECQPTEEPHPAAYR